jgi:hypothetical protein
MTTEVNVSISPERYLELLAKEEIANGISDVAIIPTEIVGDSSMDAALKIIYNKQKLPDIHDIVIFECEQFEKRLDAKGYKFFDNDNKLRTEFKVYVKQYGVVYQLKKYFKL